MKPKIAVLTEKAELFSIPEHSPASADALKITTYDSGSRKWLVNHIAWAVANNMAVIIIPQTN